MKSPDLESLAQQAQAHSDELDRIVETIRAIPDLDFVVNRNDLETELDAPRAAQPRPLHSLNALRG